MIMSEIKMYCIVDSKTNIYNNPFYAHNDEVAKRLFGCEVNRPESLMYDYSEDYQLIQIGVFNKDNGSVKMEEPFRHVCIGYSLKRENRKTPEVQQ